MNNFSYEYYIHLIRLISDAVPLLDFKEITTKTKQFFLLRHDVEFSIEKAYELAHIEKNHLGITSSYFFQIRNNIYNPFAHNNIKLIHQIHEMGHQIGLHVNVQELTTIDNLSQFIKHDIKLLQQGLNLPIDRFSFHRPTQEMLRANIKIKGIINVYDKLFFHFYEKHPLKHLTPNYFSDSEHRWKYGDPLSILEKPIKKIQLLVHPYSWSTQGLDNFNNFKELLKLKYITLIQNMQRECHHFPSELHIDEKL